jgi:excisionase family DNA binding protein
VLGGARHGDWEVSMDSGINTRELLKMDEVQACLGISKAYAYKLIKEKKIPSLRLGERGAIRVRGVDLDAFLEAKVER